MCHQLEGNKFKCHQSSNRLLNCVLYPCTVCLSVCVWCVPVRILFPVTKMKQITRLFWKLLDAFTICDIIVVTVLFYDQHHVNGVVRIFFIKNGYLTININVTL